LRRLIFVEDKKEKKPMKMTDRWEAEGTDIFIISPPSEELQRELDAIKEKYKVKEETKKHKERD